MLAIIIIGSIIGVFSFAVVLGTLLGGGDEGLSTFWGISGLIVGVVFALWMHLGINPEYHIGNYIVNPDGYDVVILYDESGKIRDAEVGIK